jgi:hypothetical protein
MSQICRLHRHSISRMPRNLRPKRSQFSSCDACRQSRVACDASSQGHQIGQVNWDSSCSRCSKRKHACTFEVWKTISACDVSVLGHYINRNSPSAVGKQCENIAQRTCSYETFFRPIYSVRPSNYCQTKRYFASNCGIEPTHYAIERDVSAMV